MAGLSTYPTDQDIKTHINSIEQASKREDARTLWKLFQAVTHDPGRTWGNEKNPAFIIGFGAYTYQRKGSKDEYQWFKLGFAPRKSQLTLYLMCDVSRDEALLSEIGKCKWGKGCLYINKLADIDLGKLKMLIKQTWERNQNL